MRQASKDWVVIFGVEFWSLESVDIARVALRTRRLTIGSKSGPGAHEIAALDPTLGDPFREPPTGVSLGTCGTDIHGMKAIRWAVIPQIKVPTNPKELRTPSASSLLEPRAWRFG